MKHLAQTIKALSDPMRLGHRGGSHLEIAIVEGKQP
jgi:hypothetical protein